MLINLSLDFSLFTNCLSLFFSLALSPLHPALSLFIQQFHRLGRGWIEPAGEHADCRAARRVREYGKVCSNHAARARAGVAHDISTFRRKSRTRRLHATGRERMLDRVDAHAAAEAWPTKRGGGAGGCVSYVELYRPVFWRRVSADDAEHGARRGASDKLDGEFLAAQLLHYSR